MRIDRLTIKKDWIPVDQINSDHPSNGELVAEHFSELIAVVKGQVKIPAWADYHQVVRYHKTCIKELIVN